MDLTPSQVIVFATPVFFALIGFEYAWGVLKGRNTYRLNDAINSITLGMISQVSGVLMPLLTIGIYTAVFDSLSVVKAEAFWTSLPGWLLALVFYDFCYYWLHRAGHEVGLFWAAHVVHHQSQDYNLSTALRQTSTGNFFGWVFYLPMAVAGVPPLVFGVVALIDLLYQFWVHTEHVGKLGWFDRVFVSPSNHRVHHAVNDGYLDRNYGGILIVWDRLFGSFVDEGEKCVYGTRAPLESWDPVWSNAEVYWSLAHTSWHAMNWADKVRVWFKPPGWRPADVEARFPKPAFDIGQVRRFHPPMTPGMAWFASGQFVMLLGGVALFLWEAGSMTPVHAFVWFAALTACLWAVGAAMQGRITGLEVLMVEAAALSVAGAAGEYVRLHLQMKPTAMVLAMGFVALRARDAGGWRRSDFLLLAALAFSLAGDVFLMLKDYFLQGLVSFLVAHLCYIALFKAGVPWLPGKRIAGIVFGLGAAMYAGLFVFLPNALKIPVALYTTAICLMAAQAMGRASVLRDRASLGVAIGAGFFMASDSLLAVNRFAVPLPMAQFWVLATYYAAQLLIVHHFISPSGTARAGTWNPAADRA